MNSNLLIVKFFYNYSTQAYHIKIDDVKPGYSFVQADHLYDTANIIPGSTFYCLWPSGEFGLQENSYWAGNDFRPQQILYLPCELFGIYLREVIFDIQLVSKNAQKSRFKVRESLPEMIELFDLFPAETDMEWIDKGGILGPHWESKSYNRLVSWWKNMKNYEALYPDHPLYYEPWLLRKPEYWKKYYIP